MLYAHAVINEVIEISTAKDKKKLRPVDFDELAYPITIAANVRVSISPPLSFLVFCRGCIEKV